MKSIICALLLLVLSGGCLSAATVSCSWFAPTKYVDGSQIEPGVALKYSIYRAQRSDMSDAVKIGWTDKLIFYDTSAARKTNYWYFVRVYIVDGKEGPESATSRFYTNRP